MFYIIGIGLNHNQITLKALETIKNLKEVYIDNYTNKLSKGDINTLEKTINKKITKLNRKELEQIQDYIKNDSGLLVIGNSMSATTHFSLIKDAKKKGIETKVLPGISIFNYRGFFGLFEYNFGKTVSIVYPQKNYFPKSFYYKILDNLKINAHTTCLLDIKVEENRYMSVTDACNILKQIDTKKKLENLYCIGLYKMGSDDQEIIPFKFKDYKKLKDIQKFPQTMVICAKEINEFEKEEIECLMKNNKN